MVDVTTLFLLGPIYFIPQVTSLAFYMSVDITTFIISGLGTAFWTSIIGSIASIFYWNSRRADWRKQAGS